MSLIKSISGIRGTIGGAMGDNLTPLDAVKFASAYGTWLLKRNTSLPSDSPIKVVLGRDARISGKMISSLVANTLVGLGIDVLGPRSLYNAYCRNCRSNGIRSWGDHHYGLPQSKAMERAQIIERIW